MPSNHLILCCPLLLLPSIPPSIRVFSYESTLCMRWPKYWSFSFSISPSSEHPGLISFRMNWLDLLAVQGTLQSFLQHHSSKASIFQCSAFFTVQLSHPYMTIGKTIALTRWTFVGKVMSLLSNMLSRLVITFLPRSKHLLISWLQSPSAVILEPKKIKSDTVSTVSPPISHEVMGPDAMILVQNFFFILYQNFHPSAYTAHLLLHSTLYISALSILIIVVLRSQTDNSNIPAMSSSDTCSVSSNCVFPFGMPCIHNFLWQLDMMFQVRGIAIHRTLVMWQCGVGFGEEFDCFMIRTQSFTKPMPLDCEFQKYFPVFFSPSPLPPQVEQDGQSGLDLSISLSQVSQALVNWLPLRAGLIENKAWHIFLVPFESPRGFFSYIYCVSMVQFQEVNIITCEGCPMTGFPWSFQLSVSSLQLSLQQFINYNLGFLTQHRSVWLVASVCESLLWEVATPCVCQSLQSQGQQPALPSPVIQ